MTTTGTDGGARMLDLNDHHDSDYWFGFRAKKQAPARIDRFGQLLNEMRDLHDAKRSDYTGDGDDILYNYRKAAETMGVPTSVAILGRTQEKVTRLAMVLPSNEWKVKDEPPTQTWLDIAIQALLGLIACEQELAGVKEWGERFEAAARTRGAE